MKKIIFTLAVGTIIMAASIIAGCQSATPKAEASQAKVQDDRQEMKEARKAAIGEEWKTFKAESESKIRINEVRIAELRVKLNRPGKIFDSLYTKKIDALEQQNNHLKARMEAYERSQSDWELFKREFNHDMDELGQALDDLMVDND